MWIFFHTIFSHIFSHYFFTYFFHTQFFPFYFKVFTRLRKFFTRQFFHTIPEVFHTLFQVFHTTLAVFHMAPEVFHAHHPPVGRCVQARATRGDAWLCGVPGRAHRRGRGWGGRAAGVRHRGPPVAALGSVWRLAARPLSGAGPAEPAGGGGSVAVNLVRRRR